MLSKTKLVYMIGASLWVC